MTIDHWNNSTNSSKIEFSWKVLIPMRISRGWLDMNVRKVLIVVVVLVFSADSSFRRILWLKTSDDQQDWYDCEKSTAYCHCEDNCVNIFLFSCKLTQKSLGLQLLHFSWLWLGFFFDVKFFTNLLNSLDVLQHLRVAVCVALGFSKLFRLLGF